MAAGELADAEAGNGLAVLPLLGSFMMAFDDRWNLGAADADIGERTIVKRHQLGVSLLTVPPLGKDIAGGGEEVDDKHGIDPLNMMVHCTNGDYAAEDQAFVRKAAMRNVS